MKTDNIKEYLVEYQKIINPILKTYLEKKIKEAAGIGKIPGEVLEKFAKLAVKGKKIRGALVVLGYQITGGKDFNSILDASIFIELLQTGVLVHDDIMDRDEMRRGIPSLHIQLLNHGVETGESLAMCAGDLAFYLSWEKLLGSNFSKERLINASRIYTYYAINVIHGQVLDLTNKFTGALTQADILHTFQYKTAEYSGVLPLLVGAALGGLEDKRKLAAIKQYGLAMGWAFQIRDDILGLYGDEVQTGKPIGSDIREGKVTLFIYYLMKHGSAENRTFIKSILGKKKIQTDDIIKVRELFKDIGAYKYVIDLGRDYVKQGKTAISSITKDINLHKILESLITYTMERVN